MLVIGRKKGESVMIGENIEVTVVKVEEGAVKLAISAPKSVTILRKELYVEVEEENIRAVVSDLSMLKGIKSLK